MYLAKSKQQLNLDSYLSFPLCNIPKSFSATVGKYFELFVLLNQELNNFIKEGLSLFTFNKGM